MPELELLLAEIMRRAGERWGDGAYEGPYARQEIIEGLDEILGGIRADARAIVARAVDLVMNDLAREASESVGRVLAPCDLTAEPGTRVLVQPGWGDRLKELAPRAADYCNVCANFPCMGGHPPEG